MSYTKVFSTMLDASIWREPNHVRIVWLTMLMMASKAGMVHASRLGLADRARVTPEEVDDALKVLGSVDPDDKSGVHSGIRVIPMQGCWQLVNFEFYRECKSIDAVRKAQWRARQGFQCFMKTPKVSETRTPTPAPEIPLSPLAKRKRKTAEASALPADWAPSDAHRRFAATKGLDLELEVIGFKGWADGRMTPSWNGTFTTRLANAAKWRAERGGKAPVSRTDEDNGW